MLRKLESRPDWQIALAISGALRLFYSIVAAAASPLLHPSPALIHSNALTGNLPAPGSWYYALLGVWERFDTLWYLRIAEHGYDMPPSVVFYPLYPWMIRVLTPLAGGTASALLISTAAAWLFLWGMARLARLEFPDSSPFRVLALTAVWPASFFLFAGYTEALALALVVWSILFGREQRWTPATACALAAGLTRSMGTLLIIPLAIMAWRARRLSAWPVLFAPAGTLAYWTWLHATGHLGLAATYWTYWRTGIAPPWTTALQALVLMAHHPDALLAVSLVFLVLFTIAGVLAPRRIEDRCFSGAVILHLLLRLCSPPLSGTPRYLLPAYPAFLSMGRMLQPMHRIRFAFLSAALFLFNLAWMWAFLNWSLVL